MYQRRNRGKPQFNRVPRVFVGAARFILAKVPLGRSAAVGFPPERIQSFETLRPESDRPNHGRVGANAWSQFPDVQTAASIASVSNIPCRFAVHQKFS